MGIGKLAISNDQWENEKNDNFAFYNFHFAMVFC